MAETNGVAGKRGETSKYSHGAKIDGDWVVFCVPYLGAVNSDAPPGRVVDESPPLGGISYGPDFAAVRWFGQVFTFAPRQRLVVAALLKAREEGYEWVSQEHLLDSAESDCGRLRDLFRGHPAWGLMIVSALLHDGPAGAYRLATVPPIP